MKFLLALAFLTAVCAIPRPKQTSAFSVNPEHLASIQRSGQGNNQVGHAEVIAQTKLLLSELELDDEKVSLDDLINALHSIRHAIRKKIHRNISHYKDSDDLIHVPFERVPVHKDNANVAAADAPQQDNGQSEGPDNKGDHPQNNTVGANKTKGNVTVSVHEPKINITQIKKEIHDKINNIIENIFRPWLGNKSIENTVVYNGNISNVSRSSVQISSRPEKDVNTINTATSGPQPGSVPKPPNGSASNENGGIKNGTAIEANNPELPPNNSASNETDGDDISIDLVEVNSNPDNITERVFDNEISNIVPIERSWLSSSGVPQNANDESTSESKVRFVNQI